MTCQFFICEKIAIGQKTKADSAPYGQGFNYKVEVGFEGPSSLSNCQTLVRKTLNQIDHALLGVDSKLISDPTTANIARWILKELEVLGAVEVRLLRGDGLMAIVNHS